MQCSCGCQKAVATVLRRPAALRSFGPLGSGFSMNLATVESTVPVCQMWAPLMPAMTSSCCSSSNRKAFKTAVTRFRTHSSAQRNSGSLLEYHLHMLRVSFHLCRCARPVSVFTLRWRGKETEGVSVWRGGIICLFSQGADAKSHESLFCVVIKKEKLAR